MSCPIDAPQKTAQASASSGHPVSTKLPSVREVQEKYKSGEPLEDRDVTALASTKTGQKVALQFARAGYRFSFHQIQILGNPKTVNGVTLMQSMAASGVIFSVTELLAAGNPVDCRGWTVAHTQAYKGHVFTVEDLKLLNNPLAEGGNCFSLLSGRNLGTLHHEC